MIEYLISAVAQWWIPTKVGMLTGGLQEEKKKFRSSSMVDPDRVGMLTGGLHEEKKKFRSSSMVEHPAVNRRVTGSSPVCGANEPRKANRGFLLYALLFIHTAIRKKRNLL